jgi:hypothetical protein
VSKDAFHDVSDTRPFHLPHIFNKCTGTARCVLNSTTVTMPIHHPDALFPQAGGNPFHHLPNHSISQSSNESFHFTVIFTRVCFSNNSYVPSGGLIFCFSQWARGWSLPKKVDVRPRSAVSRFVLLHVRWQGASSEQLHVRWQGASTMTFTNAYTQCKNTQAHERSPLSTHSILQTPNTLDYDRATQCRI